MIPAKPKFRVRHRRCGFVLVTMMLSTLVLLGFLGLAVDVGYLELVKTRMQTAADAAALGAVQDMRMNGTANLVVAAKADSALNGFTHGVDTVVITVNHPPLTGNYMTDQTAMEVTISQSVSTFFMQAVGFAAVTINARAVARQGGGNSCLYALDPSMSGAISASGGVHVTSACGIGIASNHARALTLSGGAVVTASSVSIAGNYQVSGGATVSPAPLTGVAPPADPFTYLTAPSTAGCTYGANQYSVSGGATATLNPGVYCKGISISGGSHVTFNSGMYVLKGGGMSLSGGSSVSGTGVTFFNTASGNPYGAISFSGGTTVTLAAPTTGAYAGILFYQDPSVGSAAGSSFSGGTTTVLTGALYSPTTSLSYSGGSSSAAPYTIIVADSVNFSGGSTLNNDYSSLPGGSPVKGSALVSE